MSLSRFAIVETEYGPVKGSYKSSALGRNFFNFQGIPYMKAPIGKLRFRDAEAPNKWIEPFDATSEPPCYFSENFLNFNKIEGTENAGIINVYTPYLNVEKPLPVIIFVHGGGFFSGSSQTDVHGPDFFMQKDVVLVTFNYRLGAIGFLSLDDKDLNIPGNAGLKDQNFALKWVQTNIAKFGGNSENITLIGTSAGAASTHYHMISEQSKGLFQRAITMSGCAFNSCYALIPRRDFAQRLAKALGWDGAGGEKEILEFLESSDAEKIVELSSQLLSPEEEFGENIMFSFGPTIEPYESVNCFIPQNPMLMARTAWSNKIDSIMGVVSFEGLLRAYAGMEKPAEMLQNFEYFTPLSQMRVEVSKEKLFEYGKKIKEIYYGKLNPSVTNQEAYYHFISDVYFLHGIQRSLLSRTYSGEGGKTFLYRFDCDTTLNIVKKLLSVTEFAGAAHWDDLPYLFKSNANVKFIGSPKIDEEFKLIKTMLNIFTSFAVDGKVETPETESVDWTALTAELPFQCLNISNDDIKVIPLPETDRLKIWDEVFLDAKAELF